MKSILEQNFDELYAQVEERVKCIQPVKQMDTYTKVLMWTSLNEILMDVFGGSRFMWIIDPSDTEFIVTFIDRYRSKETKQLCVQHTTVFVWPEKQTIMHMTVDELESFAKLCNDQGINKVDIGYHYSEGHSWFCNLISNRKSGSRPIDEYTFELRSKNMRTVYTARVSKWSTSKIKLFKIMYVLNEFKLPMPDTLLREVFGCEHDKSQRITLNRAFYKQEGYICATEQYIDQYTVIEVRDDVVKYIDYMCDRLLLIATNDNESRINPMVKRVLSKVAGVKRPVVFKDGRAQRICSEQETSKIISFVEQLRGIKETILMTVNNACNLKNINLLSTIKQDFDISTTNKERKTKK